MSGERFILVETLRFFGRRSWARRVCDAGTFDTEEEALAAYAREFGEPLDKRGQGMRVRRVVPAGNRRALRAELEGLRATDEEMAAKLAKAQREAEERRAFVASICEALGGEFGPAVVPAIRAMRAALATARHHRDHAMSFESQSRALVESLSTILGAAVNEPVDEAAKRVVRERDEARRELAMEQDKLAIVRASHEVTSRKLAELQRAIEVLIAQARPAA